MDVASETRERAIVDEARPTSARLHFLFLAVCFFLAAHDPKASTFNVLNVESASETYAATAGTGTITRQLAFVLLGLYGALGLPRLAQTRVRAIGYGGLCSTALLAWTLLSAGWAITPSAVLSRLVGVVAVTLAALRVRLQFQPREIIAGITWLGVLFMGIGLVCEVALGTFRPWATEYRFAGTSSPTEEAVNCSIALIGAYTLWRFDERKRLWRTLLFVSGFFCLLTKSRAALLGALLALGYFYVATRRDWRQRWLVWASIGTAVTLGALLSLNDLVSFSTSSLQFGRDPSTSDNATLTGRIPLWAELMNFAQLHPVLGAGFGGFWIAPTIVDISADQGWAISAAHSAYVDVLLSLGVVGLGLYCLSLLAGVRTAKERYLCKAEMGTNFFGTLLLFVAMAGATDSESVYVSSSLFFCFALALLMTLYDAVPQEQRKPARRELAAAAE